MNNLGSSAKTQIRTALLEIINKISLPFTLTASMNRMGSLTHTSLYKLEVEYSLGLITYTEFSPTMQNNLSEVTSSYSPILNLALMDCFLRGGQFRLRGVCSLKMVVSVSLIMRISFSVTQKSQRMLMVGMTQSNRGMLCSFMFITMMPVLVLRKMIS